MSSLVDEVMNAIARGLAKGSGRIVTVCASCVRPGEEAVRIPFGDYSLCKRCGQSATSKTPAFFDVWAEGQRP